MAWAICGEPLQPHTLCHQTIRRLSTPRLNLPSPLYAIASTLVRSCFHALHAIPILSLLYRVPATTYYPLSFLITTSSTHHTSFTYSLAGTTLKIRRHLLFDFGPTPAQKQIPLALALGPTFGGAPVNFCWGRSFCPLLPIFTAAPRLRDSVQVPGLSL